MKAHLLYRSKDYDWKWAAQAEAVRDARRSGRRYQPKDFNPQSGLPWNEKVLTADLALTTLFNAMALNDDCVFEVARSVILAGVSGDLDTIRYRQDILQDCLDHAAVVRELYAIANEALERQRGYYGFLARFPDSLLRDSIELMTKYLELLKRLRGLADWEGHRFMSEGWTAFFAMLRRDLGDEYLVSVEKHLEQLKFRNGLLLLSAELTKANKGGHYFLHRPPYRRWTLRVWWKSLFAPREPVYAFEIHPRDEAGFTALGELRNRGISLVASALGESAEHVRNFFGMLRAELAFYIGCLNVHERLARKGEPICMPMPQAAEERRLSFRGLYDIGLTLSVGQRVIGNDANANDKDLVIITGANTGGKSTLLRSVGLAQLMMQCGMFVSAEAFNSSLCDGLFTHYKREEDAGMESGKFDEELRRMSDIVSHIRRHSMILFNESFAATNEREGSEIARQIISALMEKSVKAICVTHLYELAHGFYKRNSGNVLFLRAGRQAAGARTFKLAEGKPLPTSFGEDLYKDIFSSGTVAAKPARPALVHAQTAGDT
jgi:hypothetical protein